MARTIVGEPVSGGGDRLGQTPEIGMADLIDDGRQNVRVLLKQGKRLHGARTILAPSLLGGRNHVAQLAPHSFFRSRRNRFYRRNK